MEKREGTKPKSRTIRDFYYLMIWRGQRINAQPCRRVGRRRLRPALVWRAFSTGACPRKSLFARLLCLWALCWRRACHSCFGSSFLGMSG
jgi:hypothetical protein